MDGSFSSAGGWVFVVKQRKLCPKHRIGPLERRMHLVSFGIKSIP